MINKLKMIKNPQKEIQTKLTKGLLDMIVLQILDQEPMHGYQLISKIHKNFGVCVGVSTVYPLLDTLEKKGCLKSEWNMNSERPRKIFTLTNEGHTILKFSEASLNLIRKNLSADNRVSFEAADVNTTSSRRPGIAIH
jgi:PadR family transcriptional regulator, regulatory protein PadR